MNRWFASMVAAVGGMMLLASGASAQETPGEIIAAPAPQNNGPKLTGVASCSAQACHGDLRRDDAFPEIWGNEHTIWVQSDPHAKAYLALYEQRSLDMARRLGLGKPYQAQECLACHAPMSDVKEHAAVFEPSDAVGCESCHGSAERWLAAHTERDWKQKSAGQKMALGMRDTEDPLLRAQLCASCHVGEGKRTGGSKKDVNHDLIAAGHPRLQFELTAYLSQLRRHWDEKAEDPRRPEFDPAHQVRLWAVGQTTSAQSAMKLLADRVADQAQSWPELAEFDCYSCHHQIQSESWRQNADYFAADRARPGSLRWGTWYVAPLTPLRKVANSHQLPVPKSDAMDELVTLMQGRGVDRNTIARQASSAADQLGQWADELNRAKYPEGVARDLMRALFQDDKVSRPTNWDTAAQQYLMLRALDAGHRTASSGDARNPSAQDEQITVALKDLRKLLAFPAGPNDVRYDSPKGYDPAKLHQGLDKVRELLHQESR